MNIMLTRVPPVAWIDCLGTTLAVEDGLVSCPLEDRVVSVATCLDCHHLSATAEERHPDRDCRTPDGDRLR